MTTDENYFATLTQIPFKDFIYFLFYSVADNSATTFNQTHLNYLRKLSPVYGPTTEEEDSSSDSDSFLASDHSDFADEDTMLRKYRLSHNPRGVTSANSSQPCSSLSHRPDDWKFYKNFSAPLTKRSKSSLVLEYTFSSRANYCEHYCQCRTSSTSVNNPFTSATRRLSISVPNNLDDVSKSRMEFPVDANSGLVHKERQGDTPEKSGVRNSELEQPCLVTVTKGKGSQETIDSALGNRRIGEASSVCGEVGGDTNKVMSLFLDSVYQNKNKELDKRPSEFLIY